jgi:hypothetical protein
LNRWVRQTRYAAGSVVAWALLAASPATAQVPISAMHLSFVEPTAAAVAPGDSIPVWVRLQNNAESASFIVDPALPLFGLTAQWVPTQGSGFDPSTGTPYFAEFASYDFVSVGYGRGCNDTFTAPDCQPAAYRFEFALDGALNLPLTIAPGASLTYRLGTFFPEGGSAPLGRYEFYQASLSMLFVGVDALGRPLSQFTSPVRTCTSDSAAGCAQQGVDFFVRTVVPEPATYALLGLGLLAVLVRARRASGSTQAAR